MDTQHFDALVRSWDKRSRRASLRWLAGGTLAGALTWLGTAETGAKKKNKKNKKKKKENPCGVCPGDMFCCDQYKRCCPVEGLPICCPFGCCKADADIACGPDIIKPCINTYYA